MRVIVFECARARPCRLCVSFWVGLRAHTHTHSVHAREHMPVFETVVLTMLSNTLEDKARRQPALYCHSVFSVLPFSIQRARLPQHAGYTSSMRFACRHPRGQGAPPRVLPIGIQWARLRPARWLHGSACSSAQSRIHFCRSAGAVLPASNAQAPPARFVFPWVGARASVASFAPACRAQMTDANSCSHFLRSFCVHCRRGAPRAQKFDACAGAPGAQFTPAMKAAWAWLWIWLTESMLVVEKVPAQTSAGADATNTGG